MTKEDDTVTIGGKTWYRPAAVERMIEAKNKEIVEVNLKIEEQNQWCRDAKAQLIVMSERLAKDLELIRLGKAVVVEKDEAIRNQRATIAHQETVLKERDAEIKRLRERIDILEDFRMIAQDFKPVVEEALEGKQ
jgi:hypothetical protein